jgi:hypothetical protein
MKEETQHKVRRWMLLNADHYSSATELAEGAALAFSIYSNGNFDIPEWVFEDALVYRPVE